ncbi:MAG: indolepyruvate ferredoxin oxidoreductase family protein [Proteobacteria bacterium]|nr:indolepyruvate ferredoxin oxidoreductase family protein [Pseudomonadota bacterium]
MDDANRLPPGAERFLQDQGRIHLTGLQALARLPLEQVRRDARNGLRTGAFISGYPGSPLAGFDQLLARLEPLLREHHVEFQPGLNEELAAAAVAGSQLVDRFPHDRFDGALGLWFGKAPGVDRCLDVFRHANFTGVSRHGGAVALAGDDPACKSSSLPSHSEHAFAHAMIPLLAPETPGDALRLGLHAYALSRFAGVWVGLKVVADLCDGGEIVELAELLPETRLPELAFDGAPFEKRLDTRLLPPMVNEIEYDLVFRRLEAVRAYARHNRLDAALESHGRDRVGIVAAGANSREVGAALELLGLDARERERLGIRRYGVRLLYPFDEHGLREFAAGLDHVVVADGRRGYLEGQVKQALADAPGRPRVVGQRNEDGAPWLARRSSLTSEGLATDLGPYLARLLDAPELADRAAALTAREAPVAVELRRRPHFCSGCPHLTSTQVPEGHVAAGGIGCHTMVLLANREVKFFGAMGSEGAHWNGLAPFVDTPHLFQNLGDGTYFHSGRAAIRACVAAGSRITFKLLYNGAVAMTGGQRATGEKPLASVLADLLSDGVQRIAVVSEDAEVLRTAASSSRIGVHSRDQVDAALRGLAGDPGVTAFVYDVPCANEKQRQQRRGLVPAPTRHVWIHEDVCEGCGDCGQKSECLSVRPVDTALGRKTQIHQATCSQDATCLAGDCPAFLTVEGPPAFRREALPEGLACPEEEPQRPRVGSSFSVLMVGIGSTGVVTIDAILVAAARREGLYATHLDQTGLSQRGGRVASHLRLSREPLDTGPKVPWGGCDTFLAFDPLGAADGPALPALDPARTRAVWHDHLTPTAAMVSDPAHPRPSLSSLRSRIEPRVREIHSLAAEPVATAATAQPLCANVLLLGFAFERGTLPLSSAALEGAIRGHGVAVDANLEAFRLGRALARDPSAARQLARRARPRAMPLEGSADRALALYGDTWRSVEAVLADVPKADEELLDRVAGFAVDLASYQSREYGRRYLRSLRPLLERERSLHPRELAVSPLAARELYRVMAYKDEYEVARLFTTGPFGEWLGARYEQAPRLRYHLHPPLLRALGLKRKLSLGRAAAPLLRALARLRFLRGRLLDPFGHTELRRAERELVAWLEAVIDELARHLDAGNRPAAARILESVGEIRGYEQIKLDRIARVRAEVSRALADWALDERS